VDGVSLTHGEQKQHIWTFAAGPHEDINDHNESQCPCRGGDPSPEFVGNDYFCDTGSTEQFRTYTFYGANPLWDGAGHDDTCCSLNNPPWFYRELEPTNDDIEMRVCRNEIAANEDVDIESVEIYVQ